MVDNKWRWTPPDISSQGVQNAPSIPGVVTTVPVVVVPKPESIQEAKAAGIVAGHVVAAQLVPASGPLNVAAETIVAVVAKNWKDTPSYKAIRAIVIAAGVVVFITFGSAVMSVWTSGKSVFDKGAIDWRATERVTEIAGGMSLVGGLMAYVSKQNKNPSI